MDAAISAPLATMTTTPPPPPPSAPAENFFFYVAKSGEVRGPTPIAILDVLRRSGDVVDSTLLWRAGDSAWQPYKAKQKKAPQQQQHENTAVFVQGLPSVATAEDVAGFFAKCGIIKKDPITQHERVKVYVDDEGRPTGEALVIFLQTPSVDLAVDLLDGTEFGPGYTVRVSPATFDASRDAEAPQQPKRSAKKRSQAAIAPKAEKRVKDVLKKQEQLALSWSDGAEPVKETALCIVVLKNMFDPQELEDGGPAAVDDLVRDIDEGLADMEGEVKKVTLFKKPGVVLVRYTDPVHAENCVRMMRGRWFDGRRIDAHLWDGVTEYGPKDAEAEDKEQAERMDKFGDFLEGAPCTSAR